MGYSYKTAMEVLNDADKNRIIACYLSIEVPNPLVDWETATKAFGCASVDSMKVMMRTALKKIEKAGGKEGVEATAAGETAAKGKGGRKRKTADSDDANGHDTPGPKKRGKKATPKKEVESDEEAKTGAKIKEEMEEEQNSEENGV